MLGIELALDFLMIPRMTNQRQWSVHHLVLNQTRIAS